ncbi:MAG: hypothetical protein ACRDY5_01295 [Acidimicrobiales bacterium]
MNVDRWLFRDASAHRLAVVRSGLAVVIGLRIGLGPYAQLAGQPRELFDPPPLVSFLGRMPGTTAMLALQVIGTAAALAAAVRWRPRATFAMAWACLLLLAGLKGSLGKILHNDVLLLLTAVPMLGAPTEARPGDHTRSARYGWPVEAGVVVVAVAYFSIGVQKMVHSGLDWVTGDNMRWIMYQAAGTTLAPTDGVARAIADRPWLAHSVAAGIVALELSAPLVIFSRRFRPWFTAAAVTLHAATWVTLGLDYWGWALTVVVVMGEWGRVTPRGV